MGIMVTLSFLGGLRCILSGLFWSPVQYMHHPIIAMRMRAGRSIIIVVLLRLRLPFGVTNFAPDYSSAK